MSRKVNTVFVYRVEAYSPFNDYHYDEPRKLLGVYNSNIFCKNVNVRTRYKNHNHYGMPAPYNSGENGTPLQKLFDRKVYTSEFFFGFESIKQYRKWFKGKNYRAWMYANSARIVVYKVPSNCVVKGNCQLVFNISKAVRVTELRPV